MSMSERLIALCLPLAATAMLAGCEAAPADAIAAPADAAPADGCLAMLPSAALTTPVSALHTRELDAPALDATARDCLARTFGDTPIATPQAYDRSYASVQSTHHEYVELQWDDMPHEHVVLLRLAQTGAYGLWLLRIDTGLALEGARYDVLFSSGPQGQLLDTLLAGADGAQLQRDVDLRERGAFVLRERSGREDVQGPDYVAAFHVDDVGRFVHDVDGDVSPLAVDAPMSDGDVVEHGDAGGESLEVVDGKPGEIEPVRTLLFSDSGVLEESVVARTLGDGTPVLLAIGRSDVASFVVYLLVPADAADAGRATYHVASRVLQEPADVLDGSIALAAWDVTPRSRHLRITLDVAHDVIRPGGDPSTGEPDAQRQTRQVQLDYDPNTGRLELDHG